MTVVVSPAGNSGGPSSETVAPPHVSVAVAVGSATVSWPEQSVSTTMIGVVSTVSVGGVVSSMVKVAVVADSLVQSSVAVKVTVAAPVSPQPSDRPEKSLLQTNGMQCSAKAPPCESSHAFSSVVCPVPSHSRV